MNKFIAFVVVIAAVATVNGNREQWEAAKASCKQSSGATDAEASEIGYNRLPTSRNAKCMLACIQKTNGWMDGSNQFSAATAISKMQSKPNINADVLAKFTAAFNACNGSGGGGKDNIYNKMSHAVLFFSPRNSVFKLSVPPYD